jgi:copper chaperone CopZ
MAGAASQPPWTFEAKAMKKILTSSLLILVLSSCSEPAEALFFTEGNCQECGPLIEAALEEVAGVEDATWSYETSFTTIQYDPSAVNEDQLQQALAEAGFATGFYPPNEAAREALPACCRERIDRKLEPARPLPQGHE